MLRMVACCQGAASSSFQGPHGAVAFTHAVRHALAREPTHNAALKAWSSFWSLLQTLVFMLPALLAAMLQAYDDAVALLFSLPRTTRTVMWAVRAGAAYKRHEGAHRGEDFEGEPYQASLADMHTLWGTKLAAICRANGGVYVKAGQFASTFGAVPAEIRCVVRSNEMAFCSRPASELCLAGYCKQRRQGTYRYTSSSSSSSSSSRSD